MSCHLTRKNVIGTWVDRRKDTILIQKDYSFIFKKKYQENGF